MSNSKLVTYTLLSPNHSGKRTMAIDRITPHCVVGQLTAAGICGCFTSPSVQASCNYGIGKDGDIGLCVEERNRSWCTSSNANDQRAVTIECASDKTHPYAFPSKCYNALVKLCVDICKRNGKKKLLWFDDKSKTLNYSPKSDEMVLTVHRWFAAKECPGDWMYSRMGDLAKKVTALLSGETIGSSTSVTSKTYYRVRKSWSDAKSQIGAYEILDNAKNNCPIGYSVYDEAGKAVYTPVNSAISGKTQSSQIAGTEKEKASQILEIIHKCDNSGILYSVTAAQMILESGYCTTELSKKANNCFGMKCTLSGNTWKTVWDGRSKVNIRTQEQDRNGNTYYIYADFRKYPCIEDSIKDHAAYLIGAMNGNKKRYAGLTECKDYKSAITLIKNGGYATDVSYISKICNIIQRFGLDKYDKEIIGNAKDETGKITKISEWIQTIKDWERKMIEVGAIYSNNNNKTDYEVALKQKPVLTNCALFVTHALQVAGIFERKDKFYGSKGTLIKGSAASKMGTIGKITTYSKANVTANKANIPVGAIVTWHEGHTNVYLGKNDKGQMIWSDAGRGTNVGCKENSYWKSFRKTGNMPGYHVANMIALKLIDDATKNDNKQEEIPTIEGRQYIVQAGAFAVEANAKKQVAALKKKGFEAIVKKRSNDWYVQCGVFADKKNADDLIAKLQKAGFSAILRF